MVRTVRTASSTGHAASGSAEAGIDEELRQLMAGLDDPGLSDAMLGLLDIDIDNDGLLGEGSYARVHRVRWKEADTAAKVIHRALSHPDNMGRDRVLTSFLEESRTLLHLRHPNIVQAMGFGYTERGELVILMELMEDSLRRRYHSDGEQQRTVYLRDAAVGLCVLHSCGIIHRDLTPRNVLVKNGRAKLSDVGSASRISYAIEQHRRLSAAPGCLSYMSPEACGCPPNAEYGLPLDVFSFGVTMLSAFTELDPSAAAWQAPRLQPDGGLVSERVRRADDFHHLRPDHGMRQTIIACLHTDPEQRPTAGQVLDSLEEFLRNAEEEEIPEPVQPPVQQVPAAVCPAPMQAVLEQLQDTLARTAERERNIDERLTRIGDDVATGNRQIQRIANGDERQQQQQQHRAPEDPDQQGRDRYPGAMPWFSGSQLMAVLLVMMAVLLGLTWDTIGTTQNEVIAVIGEQLQTLRTLQVAASVNAGGLALLLSSKPEWRVVGGLPFGASDFGEAVLHSGHIYIGVFLKPKKKATLMKAPVHDLQNASWRALQGDFDDMLYGAKSVDLKISNGTVYCFVQYLVEDYRPSLWEMASDDTDSWSVVARMSQPRSGMAFTVFDSRLITAGGHDGKEHLKHSEQLFLSGGEPHDLPRLPFPVWQTSLLLYDEDLVLISEGNPQLASLGSGVVLNLPVSSLYTEANMPESQKQKQWVDKDIPHAPCSLSASHVWNDRLVVAGGLRENAACRESYVLDKASAQWLQFGSIGHGRKLGRLVTVSGGLLLYGGFVHEVNATVLETTIEFFPI